MPVQPPTIPELARIAESFGLQVTNEDLESYRGLMLSSIESYRRLDEMTEPVLPVEYPRTPGHRPRPEDNRLGAWYWRCDIHGAPEGALAGKTVVLKDNICVAGVPMMNGTNVLEGYIPDVDATVVTRVLDAGGTIAGKAVCESLCFSCASHTADTGPVRNPHNPELSAGGSSSGCAVLVAAGEADMAIGCDQGGSIRMPSGWCGIFGLKPTYGLVPYTGVYNLELTLDHAGPMARTTADVALLLEAIAGTDGMDPRQHVGTTVDKYTAALTGDRSHQAVFRRALADRARVTTQALNAIPGMRYVPPRAAFYAMPIVSLPPGRTDEDYVLALLRATGILCVYGSGFGMPAEQGTFRIVFLADPGELSRVYADIDAFTRDYLEHAG